jgi:hypothetical protein
MFLNQLSLFARSMNRLRAGLALSALLGACGPVPEAAEGPEAPAAVQQELFGTRSCLQIFNQCNTRCARLEQSGEDASICYADCSEQFYICQCRENPHTCVQ